MQENNPCPQCNEPVTITRCRSEYSRWYGGWDVICFPCHIAYTGADTEEQAQIKACDLEKFYP